MEWLFALVKELGPYGLAIGLLIYDNLDKRKELKEWRAFGKLVSERSVILSETATSATKAGTKALEELKELSKKILAIARQLRAERNRRKDK